MPRKTASNPIPVLEPPATSPEAREDQLIALAVNLAEQQLRDGTASAQVITHFLKIGSSREVIEKKILKEQEKLISAKTKAYESAQDMKSLYKEAIEAFKSYNGTVTDDDEYED